MKKTFSIIVALLLSIVVLAGCNAQAFQPGTPTKTQQPGVINADNYSNPEENSASNLGEKETESLTPAGQLKIHFINVGQGDAILI